MKRLLALALLATLPLASCGDKGSGGAGSVGSGKAPAGGAGGYAPGGYGYAGNLGADLDKRVGAAAVRGRKFLLGRRDDATGAWEPTGPTAAGVTAIATLALIGTTPRESVADDPTIGKSLAFLASKQQENGAVSSNPQFVNYETSVAVSAFAHAKRKEHAAAQAKARDYLLQSQVQGDEKDLSFGGFPYRGARNPDAPTDLSNLQFAVTAAHDAEVRDAAFWGRVQAYLARVQNRSETNTLSLTRQEGEARVRVVSGDDGGAAYAPGESKAGFETRPDGARSPRSYGSMTYALLKCLLFAGAKPDDARVAAALEWLRKNFAVDRNPGFEADKDPAKAGQQGYYYYLLTMARALAEYERAQGKPLTVTDAAGRAHAWRQEVAAQLVSLQKPDGSWANPVDRWEEGSPVLVTAYALQTLALCQGRLP